MKNYRRMAPAFFLGLLAVSILSAIYALLVACFAAGDVYAPYSSLRSDPLGTRIYYEALTAMPEISVERGLTPFNPHSAPHVRIYAGASPVAGGVSSFTQTLGWLAAGGRLVIAFDGRVPARLQNASAPAEAETGEAPDNECPDGHGTPRRGARFADQGVSWHEFLADLGCTASRSDFAAAVAPSVARRIDSPATVELPETIAWHSLLVLDHLSEDWTALYGSHVGCGMAFRAIGKGGLIVMTESYPLSNEAMRANRESALLAWLIAGHQRVVFDEFHLGMAQKEGVGGLLRRYRLQGVVLALGVVGLLVVWRGACPLVPWRGAATLATGMPPARNSGDALVSLLRRSVPPARLPTEWCRAWERNHPHKQADDQARLAEALSVAENRSLRKLPETFARISRLLAGHRRSQPKE